jgi:YD repeat-containing protein
VPTARRRRRDFHHGLLGNVSRQQADGAARVRFAIDAAGKTATHTFDPAGNLLSERDANGVGRDCLYDGVGQHAACTDTHGDTVSWTFDAEGNQTGMTDGAGVHSTCAFDFRNRKTACTDGVGAITRWAYDGNSNLTSVTDGEARVTSYVYDSRNLRVTETFPDSSSPSDHVTKTYDAAGRLATRTDQGGNTISYTYDAADRLIRKTDPDTNTDGFTYDVVGRLLRGTSQRYGTTVARTYDSGGRLHTEGLTPPSQQATYTVAYSYDRADRVTALQYPDGSSVTRTYTSRNLLESISLDTQAIATLAYDDGGRLTSSTLGNGLTETRTYRNDEMLNSISTPGVGDFSYTYDGRKRKLTEGGNAVN